jgi:hypothetical protein
MHKARLPGLLILLLVLPHCKKTDISNQHYLSFNIDGEKYSLVSESAQNFVAKYFSYPLPFSVTGSCLYTDIQSTNAIPYFMTELSDTTIGTYIVSNDSTIQRRMLMFFFTVRDGNNQYKHFYVPDATYYTNISIPFTITITNISNKEVEGSFHGTCFDDSVRYRNISEGKFRIPYVHN